MRGDLDDKELRLLHVEALAPQSVPSWPAWLGAGSDHDPDLGRSELDFLRFAWSGAGSASDGVIHRVYIDLAPFLRRCCTGWIFYTSIFCEERACALRLVPQTRQSAFIASRV